MAFCLLIATPLILGVVAFIFLNGITWKEFLCLVAAQVLVAAASAGIIYYSNTSDSEVWNGIITGKKQVSVPCSHSYRCHCHNVPSCSGSGKNRSCGTSEKCDTCYEHYNDWDWDVYSSIGSTFTIDRVDRRGSDQPPRWGAVRMGEPMSVTHSYTNYIKASPGTLFRHQGVEGRFIKFLPKYPDDIYDYYRLNRLVLVNGASVPDVAEWNAGLAALNGKLGARRQSNMIVVLAKNLPDEFYYALEEAWIGGKKNDTVLVIGVDAQLKPTWSVVMAWCSNELFEVKLRDNIMDLPTVTSAGVLDALDKNVSTYYKRKPMADFEYLSASIAPSGTEWTVSFIIGLLISVGLIFVFQKYDVFDEERFTARRKAWQ